jgi:hypothetical protein
MSARLDRLVGPEDPNTLFELIEELAVGSFGTVYKVGVIASLASFSLHS